MKLIAFDFFGINPQFSIFGKEKFKTFIGGIMSIILVILTFLFIIYFGLEFFERKNPRVLTSNVIPKDYELVNLNKKMMIMPFRIEDYDTAMVDDVADNKIFMSMKYFYYSRENENSGEVKLVKSQTIPLKKCNEVLGVEKLDGRDLSKFKCMDYDQVEWGGYWDGNFVAYLQLDINYCPEGLSYSENNNCTQIDDLKTYLLSRGGIYVSFLYPQFYFEPQDEGFPLKIWYKNYFYRLDYNLQKTDRLYYGYSKVLDIKGIIFDEVTETSLVSMLQQTSDFGYRSDNQYNIEGINSRFYRMFIYFDKNFTKFTRTYMKLQDVAAVVGGFLKLLIIIAEFISVRYSFMKFKELLMNSLFTFEDKSEIKQTNEILLTRKVINSNIRILKSDESRSNENKMMKLNFKDYLKMIFPFSNPQVNTLVGRINSKFMKKMDIYEYIMTKRKLKNITKILLNMEERYALDYVQKPYFTDNEKEINKLSREKKVIDYFKNQNLMGVSHNNNKMFSLLSDSIKKKILEN